MTEWQLNLIPSTIPRPPKDGNVLLHVWYNNSPPPNFWSNVIPVVVWFTDTVYVGVDQNQKGAVWNSWIRGYGADSIKDLTSCGIADLTIENDKREGYGEFPLKGKIDLKFTGESPNGLWLSETKPVIADATANSSDAAAETYIYIFYSFSVTLKLDGVTYKCDPEMIVKRAYPGPDC